MPPITKHILSKTIRTERRRQELTQRECARRAGCGFSTWRAVESDTQSRKPTPALDRADRMLRAVGFRLAIVPIRES